MIELVTVVSRLPAWTAGKTMSKTARFRLVQVWTQSELLRSKFNLGQQLDSMMKILIPSNSVLWSNRGFCLGKDLAYGSEIYTINQEGNLHLHPITEIPDTPEPYRACTILTKSGTHTSIPAYGAGDPPRQIDRLEAGGIKPHVDPDHIAQFKATCQNNASDLAETAGLSAVEAYYLGTCGTKPNKEALYLESQDAESANKMAQKLKDDLGPILGGHASVMSGVRNSAYNAKQIIYITLYRSDKLYKIRSMIELGEGKIHNSVYSGSLEIFFRFLAGLFSGGFRYHLDVFKRVGGKNILVKLDWNLPTRNLLQASCDIWQRYSLYQYQTQHQRNINELVIRPYSQDGQIVEVKRHMADCHEIEIPDGHCIILDNTVITPVPLDGILDEISTEWDIKDVDLQTLRGKINASLTTHNVALPISKIISSSKKSLRTIGKVKSIGKASSGNTRYGDSRYVILVLHDETGEIKMKLWGEMADTVNAGDILDISNAYTKRGILYNAKGGRVSLVGHD